MTSGDRRGLGQVTWGVLKKRIHRDSDSVGSLFFALKDHRCDLKACPVEP